MTTVSRVINGMDVVSEDLRQKVMRVVQETGFRPHPLARALARERNATDAPTQSTTEGSAVENIGKNMSGSCRKDATHRLRTRGFIR